MGFLDFVFSLCPPRKRQAPPSSPAQQPTPVEKPTPAKQSAPVEQPALVEKLAPIEEPAPVVGPAAVVVHTAVVAPAPVAPVNESARVIEPTLVKQPDPTKQLVPSNVGGKDQGPSNEPIEQTVFDTITGGTIDTEVIFHLGTEDIEKGVNRQVGVKNASGVHIKGGFFGAGSASVAKHIATNQSERQMALDMQKMELEQRKLALEERRQQFQFERERNMAKSSNVTSGQPTHEKAVLVMSQQSELQ